MSTPATYPRSASDGLTQALVLSVPVLLKVIANWLESHPEAPVDVIYFDRSDVVVEFASIEGVAEFVDITGAIGGTWVERVAPLSARYSEEQEIAPGVRYRLTAARSSLVEAA